MSNLPERYAYAVTRLLPQSQRKEVADELRTSIEDMASDRAKNGKPTEADIKAVLEELGDPAILAYKYKSTKRYLIGPIWYGPYMRLLKMLLCVVPAVIATLILALNLSTNQESIVSATIQAIGSGIGVAIQIAFWVTLVFAALERFAKPEDLTRSGWTPAQLPQVPKHPERQISVAEAGTTASLVALGTLWVALMPILHVKDGVPLLNPQMWEFWLPVFFILAALTCAHKLWLLRVGNWTTPLMATNLLLGTANIVYVLALVTTQQVINLEYFHARGFTTSIEDLAGIVQWSTGITTAALIATYIWESAKSVVLNHKLTQQK